jgi:hypothetical protein
MQLGKALIGAIIGGALGIAALIAVQYLTGVDQTWLAIVVALFTGLGVRAMVSTSGHASYLRGALTAILALAAFWGGTQLFSELAQRGVFAKSMPAPKIAAPEVDVEVAEDDGETDVVVEPVAPPVVARVENAGARNPRAAAAQSPWDFVWLCLAALVAYELGRGTSATVPKEPVIPPPDAT